MTERTDVTWTCDRCHTSIQTAPGGQPAGWARIHIGSPPKSPAPDIVADLCDTCLPDVRLYIASPPPPKPPKKG